MKLAEFRETSAGEARDPALATDYWLPEADGEDVARTSWRLSAKPIDREDTPAQSEPGSDHIGSHRG